MPMPIHATIDHDVNEPAIQIQAGKLDLANHDCTLTLTSPRTGDHRTFRIQTIHRGELMRRLLTAAARQEYERARAAALIALVGGSL